MSAPQQDESRWRAVLEREPSADGAFYYGVRTTGVYCRPTCAAKRPSRGNVEFYETPEDARRAGLRACRRCRPDSVSADQMAVALTLRLVEAEDRPAPLTVLALAAGYSPSHLQRVFKRQTGLSPRQYAEALRMERWREELRRGTSVTGSVYASGFGSTHSAYRQAKRGLGMTPAAFRSGGSRELIRYASLSTDLGDALVAATDRGVCAVHFGRKDELAQTLGSEFPNADLKEDEPAMSAHLAVVKQAAAGAARDGELRLDLAGSDFQRRVWAALREIPRGETRTYGQIARQIGQPTAVRAVAMACASNPLALLIPCHRVVRADGSPGGYRWGVELKRKLLRSEAAIG